jgi:purine-binding chemotaxis protein CheW
MSNIISDNQYVIFKLGEETFGVEINRVREIIEYQKTTQIPETGDLIDGVINLRGHVISIFNLRRKFGFPDTEITRSSRIVVVEAGNNMVGIGVDSVTEVQMITGDVIEKPPSLITSSVDSNYISGVAKIEERLVIILDLEKVINIRVNESV